MTGLEKVTGKIIADAEADARATLAAAQADWEAADAAAAAKTEADCDGLRESAGREGESLIRRAKSAAEMARRDVLLKRGAGLSRKHTGRRRRKSAICRLTSMRRF